MWIKENINNKLLAKFVLIIPSSASCKVVGNSAFPVPIQHDQCMRMGWAVAHFQSKQYSPASQGSVEAYPLPLH